MARSELPGPKSGTVLLETGLYWTVCLILLYVSTVVSAFDNFWGHNAATLPAAFCLVFPVVWAGRRNSGLDTLGLTTAGWGRAVITACVAGLIVFPPYIVGYEIWMKMTGLLRGPLFSGYAGMSSPSLPWLVNLVFIQVFAVALPEEVFYRGWVQSRLAGVFKGRVNILGVPFGFHIVVASALFALSHLVAVPSAFRLAVFFPGLLFGYLRERTGSVVAPVLLHAASNVLLALLQRAH